MSCHDSLPLCVFDEFEETNTPLCKKDICTFHTLPIRFGTTSFNILKENPRSQGVYFQTLHNMSTNTDVSLTKFASKLEHALNQSLLGFDCLIVLAKAPLQKPTHRRRYRLTLSTRILFLSSYKYNTDPIAASLFPNVTDFRSFWNRVTEQSARQSWEETDSWLESIEFNESPTRSS